MSGTREQTYDPEIDYYKQFNEALRYAKVQNASGLPLVIAEETPQSAIKPAWIAIQKALHSDSSNRLVVQFPLAEAHLRKANEAYNAVFKNPETRSEYHLDRLRLQHPFEYDAALKDWVGRQTRERSKPNDSARGLGDAEKLAEEERRNRHEKIKATMARQRTLSKVNSVTSVIGTVLGPFFGLSEYCYGRSLNVMSHKEALEAGLIGGECGVVNRDMVRLHPVTKLPLYESTRSQGQFYYDNGLMSKKDFQDFNSVLGTYTNARYGIASLFTVATATGGAALVIQGLAMGGIIAVAGPAVMVLGTIAGASFMVGMLTGITLDTIMDKPEEFNGLVRKAADAWDDKEKTYEQRLAALANSRRQLKKAKDDMWKRVQSMRDNPDPALFRKDGEGNWQLNREIDAAAILRGSLNHPTYGKYPEFLKRNGSIGPQSREVLRHMLDTITLRNLLYGDQSDQQFFMDEFNRTLQGNIKTLEDDQLIIVPKYLKDNVEHKSPDIDIEQVRGLNGLSKTIDRWMNNIQTFENSVTQEIQRRRQERIKLRDEGKPISFNEHTDQPIKLADASAVISVDHSEPFSPSAIPATPPAPGKASLSALG